MALTKSPPPDGLASRDEHGLCLHNSMLIGDTERDVVAAKAAHWNRSSVISEASVELSQRQDFKLRNLTEANSVLFNGRLC
jgi:histidinol phosphatase-like enzyme